MPTLIDRTSLPRWVFIIIIAVGSICIIITAALIIRCHVIRRKSKRNSAMIGQGPMRQMTVRRGRMVPASNHLSLTGSRFGLNQFDEAETARSGRKSPFEWWNSVKEKKQHDEMLQTGRGGTESVEDIYTPGDFAQSKSSLASQKEPVTTVQEIKPAFPSPTALPALDSTRTPSTSHPLTPPLSSTLIHTRHLSMIKESSPHASLVNTDSNLRKSGRSIKAVDGNLTRYEPRRPSNSSRTSSTGSPSTPSRTSQTSSTPDVPRPVAYAGWRSSLGEVEPPKPSLSHWNSTSQQDSVIEISRSRRSSKLPMPAHEVGQDHWLSRPVLQPFSRSGSNKGNVLRKKSLKRHEVYSLVAT